MPLNFDLSEIRDSIAQKVSHSRIEHGAPLNAGKFICSSSLQKAIRRGEAKLAVSAVLGLLASDPPSVWRRLLTIAFEDIGVADPGAVVLTVASVQDANWRKQVGPAHLAAFLAKRLSASPKCRASDLLWCALWYDPERRGQILQTRNGAARAGSAQAPILDHAIAAIQDLGGVNARGYFRAVSEAVENRFWPRFVGQQLHDKLLEACVVAWRKGRDALPVFVCLLAAEAGGRFEIADVNRPDTPTLDGVPLCAIDQHTRMGRTAIDLWAKKFGLGRFPRGAVRDAIFYVEGDRLYPYFRWHLGTKLRHQATSAGFAHFGLTSAEGRNLMRLCRDRLPELNEIRTELLEAGGKPRQGNLFDDPPSGEGS